MVAQRLHHSAVDLYLGGRCAGCGAPGAILCPACRATLPDSASLCWPDPTPRGLAAPYAVGPYDGLLRDLVLGHKERGLTGLRRPLGDLLARSVEQALLDAGAVGSVLLVPVPTRRASARARGRDPLLEVTRSAATALARGPGRQVVVGRLLRSRPGVVDQAGLGADARRANLAGSMACRAESVRRVGARLGAAHLVVCDDVLTTASTAREAQRALEAVGLPVLAVATVAATPRRALRPETPGTSGP